VFKGGAHRPGQEARRAIDSAVQKGDTEAAFAAFDAAVRFALCSHVKTQ
jgi:hypothetical protein